MTLCLVNYWPKIPLEAGSTPQSSLRFESGRIPNLGFMTRAGLEIARVNLD
ncbi:hypothetical protein PIB30_001711 [Stylosanthes scabra]|uniref:Uncharacterized protein n=1 Tax=Stylosanthes scabra TaxID=79078 RepID=A0ABU6U2A5_9FABA|nr:hypothetical protein [Stylosanthes scabra]